MYVATVGRLSLIKRDPPTDVISNRRRPGPPPAVLALVADRSPISIGSQLRSGAFQQAPRTRGRACWATRHTASPDVGLFVTRCTPCPLLRSIWRNPRSVWLERIQGLSVPLSNHGANARSERGGRAKRVRTRTAAPASSSSGSGGTACCIVLSYYGAGSLSWGTPPRRTN